MKTIVNIFGGPFLIDKMGKDLSSEDFFIQQMGRDELIECAKIVEPKSYEIKGLDDHFEKVWLPQLGISRDVFDSVVTIILDNAKLGRVKNLVWAEGMPLADLCRFLFDALDIPYKVIEWGPYSNTFFMVEKGLFLKEKMNIDYEQVEYDKKQIEHFLEKEREHNVIEDRTDISVESLSADSIIKQSLPYVVFFAPFSKWVGIVNKDFKSLRECIAHVIEQFKSSDISLTHTLLIKLHPVDKLLQIDMEIGDEEGVKFIDPFYSAKDLIKDSEFIVSMQSKVMFESLLFNKKVVSLGESPYSLPGVFFNVSKTDSLSRAFEKAYRAEINREAIYGFIHYMNSKMLLHIDNANEVNSMLEEGVSGDFPKNLDTLWSVLFTTRSVRKKFVEYDEYEKAINSYKELELKYNQDRVEVEKVNQDLERILKENKNFTEKYRELELKYNQDRVEVEQVNQDLERVLKENKNFTEKCKVNQADPTTIVCIQREVLEQDMVYKIIYQFESLGYEVIHINFTDQKFTYEDEFQILCKNITEEKLVFNSIENIAQQAATTKNIVYLLLDTSNIEDSRMLLDQVSNSLGRSVVSVDMDFGGKLGINRNQFDNLQEQINIRDKVMADNEVFLQSIINSLSWKITHPIRLVGKVLRVNSIRRIYRNLKCKYSATKSYYSKNGSKATLKKVINNLFDHSVSIEENSLQSEMYREYIMKNRLSTKAIANRKNKIKLFKYTPKISIIMPVYNCPEVYLRKAINSVLDQIYENFELIAINDGSSDIIIDEILKEYSKKDSRVVYINSKKNSGIVGASNLGFEKANGEFIALLDNDDELTQDALYENVALLQEYPEADFIYSDHDKMDKNGRRFSPEFKPNWSPELFLSYGYTVHFRVIRKSIVDKLGRLFYEKYKSCQDYDLLLRLTELTQNIYHISKILYHWRSIPGSTAMDVSFKPEQQLNGKLALEDHLQRRGVKAKVEVPEFAKQLRLSLYNLKFDNPVNAKKVTIVIPTKDGLSYLKPCIESVFEKTTYPNFEVIIINNNSEKKETLDYLAKISSKCKVIDFPTNRFDFALMHNEILKGIHTPYTLLLNNDTKIISGDWLTQMVGTFSLSDEIGAVGAKLLYEDRTIQHAGVVLGIHKTADHTFRFLKEDSIGYMFFPQVIRNYSACTAACLLVKTDLYKQVGGMDENLAMAYNDVDLCLKFNESGYRVVYNPNATLFHFEMKTRKQGEHAGESDYFRKKWGKLLFNDPFYNKNLTLRANNFSLKESDE